MTILEAITPIQIVFTIVIGLGVYLYYRKPSSSSNTTTRSPSAHHDSSHSNYTRSTGLDNGPEVVDEELQRAIAQIERNMIRQEQDEAYQQSLKADREKRLKKEQEQREREAKERAEREQKERLELLHQRLKRLKTEIIQRLPSRETTDGTHADEDIVKFVFKLPDGTRVKQDFRKHDKIKYVHWFVFSLENAPLQFRLTTNFPKRDLPGRPPVPEDFEPDLGEKQEAIKDSSTTITTINTNTPNDTQPKSNLSTQSNCELTLAEAGLTETQLIFVYDLEA